jgi:BASS family bile acid:Na+ symporter
MGLIRKILLNRNSILIFAVIAGLIAGDYASYIKDYNIFILAITMTFSLSGLNLMMLNSVKKIAGPFFMGIFLNYFVFGAVLLSLAWFLIPSNELFFGFVVIVAAPPGVAIIPFTYILKGKVEYAITAVTGAFLASIFLAPLIVQVFAKSSGIKPFDLFLTMVQLVVVPLAIAQILRTKFLLPSVEKIRGKIVDFGFAIIIFIAIGVNRNALLPNLKILFLVALTLFISIFGLGIIYGFFAKKFGVNPKILITQKMLVTIKSSGFSIFTAMALFGEEAAIPSAVLAVMVLLFLIFLSLRSQKSTQ